jgi:hypothetical protein
MYESLPASAVQIIRDCAVVHFMQIGRLMENCEDLTLAQLHAEISYYELDAYKPNGLRLTDKLALLVRAKRLECYEHLTLEKVTVSKLRIKSWLDQKTTALILALAARLAHSLVDQLGTFMQTHGFDLGDLCLSNYLDDFKSQGIRVHDATTRIHEYRWPAAGKSCDMWEVRLGDIWTIYLERCLGC